MEDKDLLNSPFGEWLPSNHIEIKNKLQKGIKDTIARNPNALNKEKLNAIFVWTEDNGNIVTVMPFEYCESSIVEVTSPHDSLLIKEYIDSNYTSLNWSALETQSYKIEFRGESGSLRYINPTSVTRATGVSGKNKLAYSSVPIMLKLNNEIKMISKSDFTGAREKDRYVDYMCRLMEEEFPKIKGKWYKPKKLADGNAFFLYYGFGRNNNTEQGFQGQVCYTFNFAEEVPPSTDNAKLSGNVKKYQSESVNGKWTLVKSYGVGTVETKNTRQDLTQEEFVFTNNSTIKGLKNITQKEHLKMVCSVNEVQGKVDPDGNDSTLAPPIKDLLEQHKKTFYLLGRKTGDPQPKLYLFDLGQVGGVLTYTHIKDAIVYKQVNCKWVQDDPLTQDLKFSSLEGEVDTNFYLLTPDKLDQPSKIKSITLRKANEYLLKYFGGCSVPRPEGGGSPDDNLKPDFGGGSGGGGNGGIGGGGFFPDVNNPLPNPEVPPCSGTDGGSQTPVSEIYLLKVPELTPSYDDTYDFPTKEAQHAFFIGRSDNIGLKNYSYLRKENAIQVGSHVDSIMCYNYLMYKNKAGKWYYCFIMDKQYINERTTRIIIATDVMQTYLFDYSLGPCYVERCHVPRWKPNGNPTDEFEPEGLEFGEPIQIASYPLEKGFTDTYIAVTSNPLGVIPSRQKTEEKTNVIEVEGGTDDGRKTISN